MPEVKVKGLKFHAFHGCHPEEQKTGGQFEVDIVVHTKNQVEVETDDIGDAIDYVMIMEICAKEMAKRCNLIETVAHRIGVSIKHAFNQAERVDVEVRKMHAPVFYDHEYVSVRFSIE